MSRTPTKTLITLALGLALVTVLAAPPFPGGSASATHRPADKVAVSGSALEIMGTEVTDGASSETHTLMTGWMKTSSPTDLILQVTLECALWTNVVTVGNAESEAQAQVVVWVEINGEPVPVAGDDTETPGEVVFCDRAYRMETANFDDENATIRQFLKTRSANAFNWITLNTGNGEHLIEVKARLDAAVDGVGLAKAAIGKRTLVVEPVKLANDIVL